MGVVLVPRPNPPRPRRRAVRLPRPPAAPPPPPLPPPPVAPRQEPVQEPQRRPCDWCGRNYRVETDECPGCGAPR